jgi:hypothetical protein
MEKSAATAIPTTRRRAVGLGEGRELSQDFMKEFSLGSRGDWLETLTAAQYEHACSTMTKIRTVEIS